MRSDSALYNDLLGERINVNRTKLQFHLYVLYDKHTKSYRSENQGPLRLIASLPYS